MKRKLIRYSTEEILRRKCDVLTDKNLLSILFEDHQEFIDRTWAVRKAEIEKENNSKNDSQDDAALLQEKAN